jgi:RimJ/RimL family protein N-acetyltransferase
MGKPAEAKVPVAAVINGRHGSLRPLGASDASTLYRHSHDDNVATTWAEMKVGPFADEAAFARHIDDLVSDPKRAFFGVVDLEGAILGWLCLMEARAAHQVVELGYVLFTSGIQRTTLATEALYLVIRHVFEELGYRRLEWTCTAQNNRSRVAADRLGFTYEGGAVARSHQFQQWQAVALDERNQSESVTSISPAGRRLTFPSAGRAGTAMAAILRSAGAGREAW